jgi:fatty-acyl-CoA synthase
MVVTAGDAERDRITEELRAMLEEDYPKWWVPDGFKFIDGIPKTATGKFSKKDLREEYAGQDLLEAEPDEEVAPSDEK